jgi:serine/threonine protein kinase
MVRSAPLGRLLIDTGVLTQVKLDEALVIQRTDRRRLGEILVSRGLVHPHQLAQLLSHQMSCPWISLAHLEIAPEVLALVSEDLALEHGVVPVHLRVSKGQNVLYVATDDPTDEDALASCAAAAGMPVRAMVAVTGEIKAALARYYDGPPPSDLLPPEQLRGTLGSPTLPAPRAEATRSAKPPPAVPRRVKKASIREAVDDNDFLDIVDEEPKERRAPTVLALNAPDGFLAQCREAAAKLGARMIDGGIARAGELVTEHRPCAIVVTDDVYAFDRSGLNRLALDNDAHLVVWSEEVDGRQLEPLLAGAIDRWGHSSYDKGAIVDGRYELLRDLNDESNRGTGSRWEVRNVRTARRSLLALAVRTEGDEEDAASIRREQKALARITHPGAVELRDAGTTELGDPYVVLERLEGRTLDGLVAARTRLLPDDACAVVLQLAEVLAAAHAAGVVHHQVTADKVVVTRDGYGLERVKLTGWGGATVGEPASVKVEDDLAALAMCAFEALTGRRPKPGESEADEDVPGPITSVLSRVLAGSIGAAKELATEIAKAAPKARERTQLLEASPSLRDAVSGTPAASSSEQRRFSRAAYRTPVRIEVPGIGAVDGRSEDISAGGLLVVSRGGLKSGTEVTVRFALPLDGRVVAEPAIIKWSRPARSDESSGLSAIGVELRSAATETLRQIERYVSFMGE